MLSPTAKILQLGQSFMTKYDKVLVVKAIFFYRKLQVLNGKSKKYHDFLISKKKKIQELFKTRGNLGSTSRKFIIKIPHVSTHTNHNIGIVSINFPCYLFIYLFIISFFFFASTV